RRPAGGGAADPRGSVASGPAARAPPPQLAPQRRPRACAPGGPAAWVTGAGGDGGTRSLRLWGGDHRPAHGVAVSGHEEVGRAGWHQQGPPIVAAWAAEGGAVARWGRGPRPALGCLDVAPLGRAAAAPRAPLALGAPASARPHGAAGVR